MVTAERLREVIHYDPSAGIFTWRVATTNRNKIGARAGCQKDTYNKICIDYESRREHVWAWLYMTGEYPSSEVDHKDTDKKNNKWGNLRLATTTQNRQNSGVRADSTSGYKGVSFVADIQKWRAYINLRGRQKHLGCYSSPEEAAVVYNAAAREHFGEFARVNAMATA